MRGIGLSLLAAGLLPAAWGCGPAPAKGSSKPTPPAKVAKVANEADLGKIVLTPDAEKRLGVATAVVERKAVTETRSYGGEVTVPPGRLVTVSAPFAGTVIAPEKGGLPAPGTPVKAGQTLVLLLPLLSPEAKATLTTTRVEAEGQVEQFQKQLAAAKVNLDRAKNLRRDNAVGPGALVDAQNAYDLAETNLKTAQARTGILNKTIREAEAGANAQIPMAAEADGTLKTLHVGPNQKVAPGAILFEVEALDPVWVRVPVYVGDLDLIDPTSDAAVGRLGAAPGGAERPARPISAPPSGDPLAATVDLFYSLPNPEGTLRPGQKVGVTIPLKGSSETLVVPKDAVFRDYDGGAWVYEVTGEHTYVRRRVRVDRVAGPLAVLGSGPKAGSKVVTDGAAEIFGAEFGFSK